MIWNFDPSATSSLHERLQFVPIAMTVGDGFYFHVSDDIIMLESSSAPNPSLHRHSNLQIRDCSFIRQGIGGWRRFHWRFLEFWGRDFVHPGQAAVFILGEGMEV